MKITHAIIALSAILLVPAALNAGVLNIPPHFGTIIIGECLISGGDCDGDGVPNEKDNCVAVRNGDCDTDEMNCDIDGDGVLSPEERAAGKQKPAKSGLLGFACVDLDGNGVMDYLEVDSDGDGIPDSKDNCPGTPNHDQKDWDGDGIGDICDICPFDDNPDQENICADADGDGIPDSIDNCKYKYNPEQVDSDADGIGDKCDDTPGLVLDENEDIEESGDEGSPAYAPYNGNCSLVAGSMPGQGSIAAIVMWISSLALIARRRETKR